MLMILVLVVDYLVVVCISGGTMQLCKLGPGFGYFQCFQNLVGCEGQMLFGS